MATKKKSRNFARRVRCRRLRAKIKGKSDCPRLCVFKSNKYLYAQLIDDDQGQVLATASQEIGAKNATQVGKEIAQKALKKNIKKIVFDRSGYKYHGLIKALAEGARKEGLQF
ncbi:50S ribosomal protein L18 [Patescibacteria group bacterium]|nr:50S ribosomal protein L18 [Patescibacteria group bacterium]